MRQSRSLLMLSKDGAQIIELGSSREYEGESRLQSGAQGRCESVSLTDSSIDTPEKQRGCIQYLTFPTDPLLPISVDNNVYHLIMVVSPGLASSWPDALINLSSPPAWGNRFLNALTR